MKNYFITLLLAAMSLNGAQAAESAKSDSLAIPAEIAAEYYNLYTSEDGNMSFYVWGSSYEEDFPEMVVCRIRTSNGSYKTFILPEDENNSGHQFWVTELHSIKKSDGSTYYIATRKDYISTSTTEIWLDAYVIAGDTIRSVSAFDGSDNLHDNSISTGFMYEMYRDEHLYHLLEYDPKSKELYVPTIIEDRCCLSDRYSVYQFNGNRFVKKEGEHPHKGLHSSLCQYKELERTAITKHDFIRIDRLEDGSLRYASWNITGEDTDCTSREPDIILYNGKYDADEWNYTFRNGNYSYIVGNSEYDGDWQREYLIVKHKDKVLAKREILEYEEEIAEKRIPSDVAELLLNMNPIFDDGKISVFSLHYYDHFYICNTRTKDGGTRSYMLTDFDSGTIKSFHKVEKNNGSSYYIVEEWDHKNAQLYAFSIDNDTIKSVSIYDGSDDADNSCIKLFQKNSWFNDEDYSLFEYNPISKELLVPEITEEQHFTDHYWVYRFNGERFEKRGLQPHKGLHSSLLQYKELVRSARTRDDFIRIDRLKDGSLRYAAWKISGDNDDCISREPEIVLYNGEHNAVEDYYTFRNGNYSYLIGYPEDDGDWHREFLIVKYQDKVIVKREIFN